MKVCDVQREMFFYVMASIFNAINVKPDIAEVGVHRGRNAMNMYNIIKPNKLVLIDSWDLRIIDAYSPFPEPAPWVNAPDAYDFYYGGSVRDQATHERNYNECKSAFAQFSNVHFIRSDSITAIGEIGKTTGIEKLDLLYLDANHQYEYVLRDLMYYQQIMNDDGVILMNDCCHSEEGTKQNLGVLEALTSFIKRSDYIPVALTNTDWSDAILVRKDSIMEKYISQVITNSGISFVDIPHQLISAARVVYGTNRKNMSFV